jgi:hypothetical protein
MVFYPHPSLRHREGDMGGTEIEMILNNGMEEKVPVRSMRIRS